MCSRIRSAIFPVLIVALALTAWAAAQAPVSTRVPILVELFTSEGCSSCPPADAFLAQLDRQPIAGAEMIVLSEHVDYWNHIGWKDPYSQYFFSAWQSEYGRHFGLESVYTPQMIVDGSAEFTGSDTSAAQKVFRQALTSPKVPVRIVSISQDSPQSLKVRIEADTLPSSFSEHDAEVFVVLALNQAESHVTGGENGGRTLTHVAVARGIRKAGVVRSGARLAVDVEMKLGAEHDPRNLRVVVFLREPHQGKILGAAERVVSP